MSCKKRINHRRSNACRPSCGRRAHARCGRPSCPGDHLQQYPIKGPTAIFNIEKPQTSEPLTPYLAQTAESTVLPLTIPSHAVHLTSGFPYTRQLASLGVSEAAWHAFNSELAAEARLSFGQAAALVGSAASLCAVGLWFHGIYLGSQMRHRSTIKKVNESYVTGKDGVAAMLARWNAEVFAGRGLEAHLLLPQGDVPLLPYSAGGKAWRRTGGRCVSRYAIVIARQGTLEEGEEQDLEVVGEQENGTAPMRSEPLPNYEDVFPSSDKKV